VGPFHHIMVRPQVADEGKASSREGRCKYVEETLADSRQGMVLQLVGWARCWQILAVKTGFVTKHEILPRASIETENEHEIWYLKC
jgi:hypothetical protein